MRELFFKIFSNSYFNTEIQIDAFSVSHFVYLVIIFGAIFTTAYLMRNKDGEAKDKVLRALAYTVVISYVFDFFTHDFVYGGLNIDKLPFHLCTLMCPALAFVQFNKKFERFREPVAVLSIVGTLMYLTYPANIGDGEPWCYQAVQTMLFHGAELAWGILNLTFGNVRLDIKTVWKPAIGLGLVTLWAKFGNLLFEQNWFFLEKDAFYIGLVEDGIIPKWSLMILTPLGVFLVVLGIYGIYYGARAVIAKKSIAADGVSEAEAEREAVSTGAGV